MAAYSGLHSKYDIMSCIDYAWDFLPIKEYNIIETNLKKFLDAPVNNFPNPANYVKYTEAVMI